MTVPNLTVSQWFNTDREITLKRLRGQVVVIEAFQMLCPGCVAHGLPLAQKVEQTFASQAVTVLGLHTVFEHHEAMTPVSLAAFLHEYQITFPVGVDEAGPGPLPKTMATLQLRGTPSMLVIDKVGTLRRHLFGQVDAMWLGAEIAALLAESDDACPASDRSR